jgi:hypothetical protein
MKQSAPAFFGLVLLVATCSCAQPVFEPVEPGIPSSRAHATNDTRIVHTTAGAIRGKRGRRCSTFLGIPLAEPQSEQSRHALGSPGRHVEPRLSRSLEEFRAAVRREAHTHIGLTEA